MFITSKLVSANTALTSPFKVSLHFHPDLCLFLGQSCNAVDISCKTSTIQLFHSTTINCISLIPCSNIHICTCLQPSHLHLTIVFKQKQAFIVVFSCLTSKSAGFFEGHLNECFKTNIIYMLQCILGQYLLENNTFNKSIQCSFVCSHSLLSVSVTK